MLSWAALMLSLVPAAAPAPDWVARGGESAKHPKAEFLTGFAVVEGSNADDARTQAAGALAQAITVRIRSDSTEMSAEKNGLQDYYIASLTQTTSDLVIHGLEYASWIGDGKAYALAYVSRASLGRDRRGERDRVLAKLKGELAAGDDLVKAKKEAAAVDRWLAARLLVNEAAEHAAVARSASGVAEGDQAANDALWEASRALEERIKSALKRPAATLKDAAATIALQLGQQGVSTRARFTVEALSYGATPFSSGFGREAAQAIERELVARGPSGKGPAADLVLRGTYVDTKSDVRFSIVAREAASGRAVASAETSLPKSGVPAELPLLPQNFQKALEDQKVLAAGEEVSSNLKLELFTHKGSRGLVFGKGEEIKLLFRVNRPAYVRLIYLLASGKKVPLEQAYYVDASKVNKLVEYPDAFEVAAPFGVEQLYGTAFTEQPEALPTRRETIDGEAYDVIAEEMSAVVTKTRGLKKKKPELQTSQATLTLTTTP